MFIIWGYFCAVKQKTMGEHNCSFCKPAAGASAQKIIPGFSHVKNQFGKNRPNPLECSAEISKRCLFLPGGFSEGSFRLSKSGTSAREVPLSENGKCSLKVLIRSLVTCLVRYTSPHGIVLESENRRKVPGLGIFKHNSMAVIHLVAYHCQTVVLPQF